MNLSHVILVLTVTPNEAVSTNEDSRNETNSPHQIMLGFIRLSPENEIASISVKDIRLPYLKRVPILMRGITK